MITDVVFFAFLEAFWASSVWYDSVIKNRNTRFGLYSRARGIIVFDRTLVDTLNRASSPRG